MWVDSHCHLHYDPLCNSLEDVIKRAYNANVSLMLCVSTDMDDHKLINPITSPGRIFQSIGVHPLSAHKYTKSEIEAYLKNVQAKMVVAIGETGLDDFRSPLTQDQIESFEIHMAHAVEQNLPVIMHSRSGKESDRVEKEALELIRSTGAVGVAHCFGGSAKFCDALLELGWYISFAGNITYSRNSYLQDIARNVPIERILIETDAPFLAPEPFRGKTNEPGNVVYVGHKIAELHNLSPDEVMTQTNQNFHQLFTMCKNL